MQNEKIISVSPLLEHLETVDYKELCDFQGDLKILPDENLEKLKLSLIENGIFVPKYVWKNEQSKLMLIDGNQTKKALNSLELEGWKIPKIPYVSIPAKSEKEAAEKLLIINSKYGIYNVSTTFFEDYKLDRESLLARIDIAEFTIDRDAFLNKVDNFEGNTDPDDVPEVDEKEVYVKTGDLYQLGNHRLLCGDSTKREDVDRLMNGEKADLVFTDPPYGVNYANKNSFLNEIDKGNRIQTDIENDTMNEAETQKFWKTCFEIIRDNLAEINSYYIFSPQIQGMMMMMMMMQEARLFYRHVLIWVKNNHVLGRCDYNYKHEPILFGWTTKHKFYGKGEFKTSVWNIDKPLKNDLHPTMKPVELMENGILNSSVRNQIVLDPFCGSGSTLIACEKTNRRCFAMEISPLYVQTTIERFEKFTGKKAVKL